MRHRLLLGIALLAPIGPATAQQHPPAPSDADRRAEATVRQMTQAEKIALLHGPVVAMVPLAKRLPGITVGAGYVVGIPRLGIPALVETDASMGVANSEFLRKGDVATAMPSTLGQAASWDPEMSRRGGAMIGAEARDKGFNVMLAGGVNLVRDPRAGRNFEYAGEDPLLAGTIAGAQIAGVQSSGIVSTVKHFAVNDLETGRNVHSVAIDEAAMRESDLLAFQIAIEKGDPGSVMCAYNKVNGVHACENRFLLTDVLRRDWGFRGFVMSDWGAVHSSEAIVAGLDQQSGEQLDGKRWFSDLMPAAIAEGRVPASAIDVAARRIVRTIYTHGLDKRPNEARGTIDYDAHALVSQQAAEASMVLLRNEGDVLPLVATARRIVLIGGHADVGVLAGGGSSQVRPVGGFVLEEKGDGLGFSKRSYVASSPLSALRAALPGADVTYVDGRDPAVAAAAAKAADVAIVFGEKWAGEGADQPNLSLDRNGDALIAAVAAANPRTVAVLEVGNAVAMPWRDQVAAILVAWFPGQRGGAAIARVLTGAVNPSGHLPVTFPAATTQLPHPVLPGANAIPADAASRAVYGLLSDTKPFAYSFPEGSDVGYRWFDRTGAAPLYAFGHGLSYTRFRYSDLRVAGGERLTATFTVTNIGTRAGVDVPQVYVRRSGKAKRLVGWGRPALAPGESRVVTVTADPRLLADFDGARRRWTVPKGRYAIEVATSATAPVLTGSVVMNAVTRRP
ncbi:beta-glucosidase [Sphingomonas sp. RP10(2022)]|uniref:Beta-glucosidase n=1 Tax=Sphingomonas liriopis TaxID=2949094 RepID=A0A9X2HU52_9SPHN|nr:beta-glucosidase [Sphingomonas liriopis]MCP3733519.1 beta-glucosidase [Sphingomonas liriopis]